MATITRFVRSGKVPDNAPSARLITNKLDFSALNVASGDVVNALELPAGTQVLGVGIRVRTPEGGAATATIGASGVAADTFLSAQNLNAATDAASALANPFYTADGCNVILTPNAALDAAVVDVWAIVVCTADDTDQG